MAHPPALLKHFLQLALTLVSIAAPVIVIALVPVAVGLVLVALQLLVVVAAWRCGLKNIARCVDHILTGSLIGLGIAVWRVFPFWWVAIILAVAVIFALGAQHTLEFRLGLSGDPGMSPGNKNGQPVVRGSFTRALWNVVVGFSVMFIPMVAAALLPLKMTLTAIALLCAATIIAARCKQWRRAGFISEWTGWAMFGLGICIWRSFPYWWGAVAGVVVALVGFDLFKTMENRLQLTLPPGGRQGCGRADTHYAHLQTPEGQPIRLLDEMEVAGMGGPLVRTLLFEDGILLSGVGQVGRFSRDGRYFAAVTPAVRDWDGLVVLDRLDKTLRYYTDSEYFWLMDEFTETTTGPAALPRLRQRGSRHTSLWWQDFLGSHGAHPLQAFQDLWLAPDSWSFFIDAWQEVAHYPSLDNSHRAMLKAVLPTAFRPLDKPLESFLNPKYQLFLDDKDTGLCVSEADTGSGSWRSDSQVFCIRAYRVDQENEELGQPRFWWWEQPTGWHPLPVFDKLGQHEPGLETAHAAIIEGDQLQLNALLASWVLNWGRFGTRLSARHELLEIPDGTNAAGEVRPASLQRRRVSLSLALSTQVHDKPALQVVTEPLADGCRAVFSKSHENTHGPRAWQCRIGDWLLPGLWLLEHRLLDSGQGVVLCPFSKGLPLAVGFVVALPDGRRLIKSPEMWVAGVHDTQHDDIGIIELAGRISDHHESTGLAPFDMPVPTPTQDFPARDAGRCFYRIRRFKLEARQLTALPSWRTVNCPQACNAEGDFVYPAPRGLNAAWYFGGRAAYGTGWPRREDPRYSGFVLTAHGYAIGNLSPAMIWSDDGNFLALCRSDPGYPWQWNLLLLNQNHGGLQMAQSPIPGMPRFECFDRRGLVFTPVKRAGPGEDPGISQQRLTWAELNALPSVPLVAGNAMCLEAAQADNRAEWEKLDTTPLGPYRSPR